MKLEKLIIAATSAIGGMLFAGLAMAKSREDAKRKAFKDGWNQGVADNTDAWMTMWRFEHPIGTSDAKSVNDETEETEVKEEAEKKSSGRYPWGS